MTLHELGRYEEALADKNEAVRLEPQNADYYESRSITLKALGRLAEAEADQKKAETLRQRE